MMERVERKMKRLLLASIGAAAVTREQSDNLMRDLIARGEEVIDRSGIRNECLRHNDGEIRTEESDAEDRDSWLERLCGMSPDELRVLKDAIEAVETVGKQVDTVSEEE
ncbi:MAG: hypothetical protein E7337_07625 [Clostridiales bacterium]|nr:hypothetical protein [Clostridiales bacterium]